MTSYKKELQNLGFDISDIFNNISDGITIQNQTGLVLFANDAAARLCGLPSGKAFLTTPGKEIINKYRLLDEYGKELPVQELPGRKIFSGEKEAERVVCFKIIKTGSIRWSKVHARAIKNEKGEVIAAINLFHDITTQIEYQNELKRRAILRAAVAEFGEKALREKDINKLMKEAVMLISSLLHVEFVKILELQDDKTRLLVKEGVGWKKGYVGNTYVQNNKKTQAGYTLNVKKPVVVSNLKKEKRFKGHNILLDHDIVSGVTVIIKGSKIPYGIIGVHSKEKREFTQSDIHFIQLFTNLLSAAIQRKSLDESEKRSQEQYKTLMEQASDAILLLDPHENIIQVNKRACQIFGYSQKEFTQLNAYDIVCPEDIESSTLKFDEIRKGKTVLSERRICKRDGTFILVEISSKVVDKDKILSIMRDITERKQGEVQREVLSGIVSHEIKNVLMNITGFTYILKKHFQKTKDIKSMEYFSKLEVQLSKLSKIVIDMLDLTRIRSGRMEFRDARFKYGEVLNEVIETFQQGARHAIVVKGSTDKVLYGDKNRVAQVLNNLLSNAIKYSPSAKKVIVTITEDSKSVTVSVRDFGIGIPADGKDKVFELFYRGSNTQKQLNIFGIGLGLYISDIIARHHSGKIWVESVEGKGSTFYFSLPLKRDKKRVSTKVY